MTREVLNDRIPPPESDLPDWADNTPDWREYPIDQLYHRRFTDDRFNQTN